MCPIQGERNHQKKHDQEQTEPEEGYAADDDWDADYPVFATKEHIVKMTDSGTSSAISPYSRPPEPTMGNVNYPPASKRPDEKVDDIRQKMVSYRGRAAQSHTNNW